MLILLCLAVYLSNQQTLWLAITIFILYVFIKFHCWDIATIISSCSYISNLQPIVSLIQVSKFTKFIVWICKLFKPKQYITPVTIVIMCYTCNIHKLEHCTLYKVVIRILLHVFIIWHVLYNIIIMHMHTVLNSGKVMLDFGLEKL